MIEYLHISLLNASLEAIGLIVYFTILAKSKATLLKGLIVLLTTNIVTHIIFWNEFFMIPLPYPNSLYFWEIMVCLFEGFVYRVFFIQSLVEALKLSFVLNVLSFLLGTSSIFIEWLSYISRL
ncbi:MAG: hypothetical protein KDK90_14530 [Leptospiraceae bacterium]|nr:hypothetical protein [Leptospiraceae bacterium]